jgi:heme/copper-type cytochrome/quinol oxidase subunit 3
LVVNVRGTANVVLLLLSAVPTLAAHRVARKRDRRAVGWYFGLATVLTLGTIVLRALEIAYLPVRWNTNAYGSIVWMILGTHTSHLVASALEDMLLCTLPFFSPVEDKHLVNVTASCLYFVVIAWVPLYALVYLLPRWG